MEPANSPHISRMSHVSGVAPSLSRRPDATTVGFRDQIVRALEQVSLTASLLAAAAVLWHLAVQTSPQPGSAGPGVATLAMLAVFYTLLASRWQSELLCYFAQCCFAGAYFYYRAIHPLSAGADALVLVLFCFLEFGMSEFLEQLNLSLYVRPALYFSLIMGLVALVVSLGRGRLDDLSMTVIASTGTFYAFVSYRKGWKAAGYAAAVLYNGFLWVAWTRLGWKLADHPQYFLIPVGFSAILFAEVNRRDLGLKSTNFIRTLGSVVIYVSTAVPMWQFESLGSWAALLVLSLLGIMAGYIMRLQSFFWLGLTCFVFDVVFQLFELGSRTGLAKAGILVGGGILTVLFLALNEKMQVAARMRAYYDEVRQWE